LTENSSDATRSHGFVSRIAFVLLVGTFTSFLIVLAATWIAAWRIGALPDADAWRYYDETGNGPWDHNKVLLAYVDFVFLSAFATLTSGLAAVFCTPTAGRRWLGVIASAVAMGAMWYHFHLID
jgi:hypothetical protein